MSVFKPKAAGYSGAPLDVPGDAMNSGLGPASWNARPDVPDTTLHGAPKIVPLRVATDFSIESGDPDPRGMAVLGADGIAAGTVTDVWVDRSEPQIRYLELKLSTDGSAVLAPFLCCKFNASKRQVKVNEIKAAHFAAVPRTRHADQITLLEEERIQAYYAGGLLYADPERFGPLA